jgi:hypothetical protein
MSYDAARHERSAEVGHSKDEQCEDRHDDSKLDQRTAAPIACKGTHAMMQQRRTQS